MNRATRGIAAALLMVAALLGTPAFAQAIDSNLAASAARLKVAAERGEMVSQYQLGVFYAGGLGVRRDDAEAVRWFRHSADQNFLPAIDQLAAMYEHGRGVPRSVPEAIRLYQLAAARGDIIADRSLARLTGRAPQAAGMGSPLAAASILPPGSGMPPSIVPLRRVGGVLVVAALIDDAVPAQFVVDSGAAEVSIPEALAEALRRAGKLSERDIAGSALRTLADGSKVMARMFTIHRLRVGDKVLENVRASIAPGRAIALLGQSFLQRFNSWSIDNTRQALVLGEVSQ